MPCTKCEEGNYKWGKTGECEYATKEACESANHKYSKMKPTPLGKKTYEEYEKELKEYNLSSQRFDFNSIKTLKSLEAQLDAIINKLDEQGMNTKQKVADYNETDAKHQAQSEALDRDFKKTRVEEELLREQKAVLEKAEKVYYKQEAGFDKTFVKREKSASIVFKSNDKYEATWKKGQAIADKLEGAINQVQKAAKDLGLEIPVGAYKQTVVKFDATPNNSLKEVNFDY